MCPALCCVSELELHSSWLPLGKRKRTTHFLHELTSGGSEPGALPQVRNLGAPVDLAQRYFAEGADEVTFLNITGFRDFPLSDLPMLEARARPGQASESLADCLH